MTKRSFVLIVLLAGMLSTSFAQRNQGEVIKATYVTTHLSDLLVDILKKQMPHPDEHNAMFEQISNYRAFHHLYKDTRTKKSLFVLDTILKVPHISVTGTNYYTYQDDNGIIGKEDFLSSSFTFSSDMSDIQWEITDETQRIGSYECKKANLKGSSGISVWFTTEVAIDAGPYIFHGLPGLIVQVKDLYKTITLETVEYLTDKGEFNEALTSLDFEVEEEQKISIHEVLAKKENFKQMLLSK